MAEESEAKVGATEAHGFRAAGGPPTYGAGDALRGPGPTPETSPSPRERHAEATKLLLVEHLGPRAIIQYMAAGSRPSYEPAPPGANLGTSLGAFMDFAMTPSLILRTAWATDTLRGITAEDEQALRAESGCGDAAQREYLDAVGICRRVRFCVAEGIANPLAWLCAGPRTAYDYADDMEKEVPGRMSAFELADVLADLPAADYEHAVGMLTAAGLALFGSARGALGVSDRGADR